MSDLDHSDYYQYSWESLVEPKNTQTPMIQRYVALLVIAIFQVIATASLWFYLNLDQQQTIWLTLTSVVIYVIIALILWAIFTGKNDKPVIISFQINKEGIWVDDKQYRFGQLDIAKVKALISALELNSESMTTLKLPLVSRGVVQLHFETEDTYRRLIAALKHYSSHF